MKIGLFGFGKTGKAVSKVILQSQNFELNWVLKKNKLLGKHETVSEFFDLPSTDNAFIFTTENTSIDFLFDTYPVDFIIDFSSIESIYGYGELAAQKKISIISAISHYTNKEIDFLKNLSKKTVVFWSPNITLGVNFLLFASNFLKKMAPFADIEIIEEHFKSKESVSGTAIKIAERLNLDVSDINSIRVGGIVGKHEVIFGFPFQTIRLIHESISREAFGSGALFVAENLIDKPNGYYVFDDLILPYFEVNKKL